MFLRKLRVHKDGKEHSYWSLVETVRTADGPRQHTLCYLGELNGSAHARWQKTVESVDIVLPTVEGREIWLRRITKLDDEQRQILYQLQLPLREGLEPIQILKCSENSAIA